MAPATDQSEHRINERIRAREVLLIDPEGRQLGIKPLPEALNTALQMDLDLVEVAPDANPPVCRIMDYGRFKYESEQRAKESRRKTTSTTIKEMKYRPKIGGGDFETKTRQVARFLGEGHKVKVTIMFRGRETSHPELGRKILDLVAQSVTGVAKVEAAPKLDGRNMIMVLAPDRRGQARPTRPAGSADAGSPDGATEAAPPATTLDTTTPDPTPAAATPDMSTPAAPAPTAAAAANAPDPTAAAPTDTSTPASAPAPAAAAAPEQKPELQAESPPTP